jgi:hypothetical protein
MKSKENNGLSARQLQVLPYLLACPTHEEAARKANISTKQLYAWLKQATFQEELKKQRTSIFCNALAILKTSTQKAVQTLIHLLDDKDPRIRLIASEKILLYACKSIELFEVEERISALERLAKLTTQKNSSPGHP